MRLDGPDGSSLELSVVRYEKPDVVPRHDGTDDDANWLVIAGTGNDGEREWRFQDPCLLTYELRHLIDWFEAVADDTTGRDAIGFLEPNISFRRISSPPDQRVIRVAFELESRPPWAAYTREKDDWDTCSLEFPLTADALRTASRELRADLERFPERGRRRN